MTSNRLAGTRLVDIRDDVSWEFDSSFVVIENNGQPLPPDIVATVLPGASTCQRVQAAWKFDPASSMLLLSNILADGKAVAQKIAISIEPAGHVRVNLGTRQYNLSREKKKMDLQAGGVYASRNEQGKFTISKILACDDVAVHARFYKEEFAELPAEISTANLNFVIGHVPMARAGFLLGEQHLITIEPVSADELEGYQLYLDAMRGS